MHPTDRDGERERASHFAALAFIVIGLPSVLLFAIVTPPFRVPDEVGHFWRAYAIGTGVITPRVTPAGTESDVPAGLRKFVQIFWRDAATQPEEFNRYTFLVGWREPLGRETPVPVTYPGSYVPLVYTPQAAAAAAGDTFSLRPIVTFYLGRLFAAVTFIAIVALAIRVTPVAPWAFATAALFPMSLYIAASWSADVIINACSFLFVALLLRAASAVGPVGAREVTALAVAGFAVAIGKLPFATSALLILAIPAARFSSLRDRIARIACVGAAMFAGLLIAAGAMSRSAGAPRADVDMGRQLDAVTSHPLTFPAVFVRDLATHGRDYLEQSVGRLGMLDLQLPPSIIWLSLATLLAAALCSTVAPRRAARVLAAASFLLATIGISLALYLGWTPVGAPTVEGIQGRYFIALMPLVITVVAARPLVRMRWLPFAFAGVWLLSIATALQMILQRYYP